MGGKSEHGARSISHRDRDVRRSDVRHQTVTRMTSFSSQAQDRLEPGAGSLERVLGFGCLISLLSV